MVSVVGASCAALLLNCIPQFEGTVLRGYKDPIGIVTACSGHTATAVLGRPYTKEQCDQFLVDDLIKHAEGVKSCVKTQLNPNVLAASVSFAYNVGVSRFCGSSMAKLLNVGDFKGACAELSKWVWAGDKKLNGLVKRRAAERSVCELP